MTEKVMMRRRAIWAVLACWIAVAAVPAAAEAQVNLSLEPAQISVSQGEAFELQLWARSTSPVAFDGIEMLLRWDSALVELTGNVDDDSPYQWSASGFPAASPRNTGWSDGDALYQALAPLAGSSPKTDLLVSTLQFTALQQTGSTEIAIPTDGETEVAAGGMSVLGAAFGATVVIESENDGGPPGGGGDPPDQGDDDDSSSNGESESDGETEPEPGTNTDDGAAPDGTVTSESSDGDAATTQGDDGNNGTEDETEETIGAPPLFAFCGAGVAEAMVVCLAGLGLVCGQRSRRGAV